MQGETENDDWWPRGPDSLRSNEVSEKCVGESRWRDRRGMLVS